MDPTGMSGWKWSIHDRDPKLVVYFTYLRDLHTTYLGFTIHWSQVPWTMGLVDVLPLLLQDALPPKGILRLWLGIYPATEQHVHQRKFMKI